MLEHLYAMKRPPTVKAIQFKNNFYEVKSFLKYSGFEVVLYRATPFEIKVGNLVVKENDYIALFDEGVGVMSDVDFEDTFKRIY